MESGLASLHLFHAAQKNTSPIARWPSPYSRCSASSFVTNAGFWGNSARKVFSPPQILPGHNLHRRPNSYYPNFGSKKTRSIHFLLIVIVIATTLVELAYRIRKL
jgi:hypothetical protein